MAEASVSQNKSNTTETETSLPGAFKLFSPSWKAVQLNLVTIIELILIPVMVSLVLSAVSRSSRSASLSLSLVSDVVAFLFAPAIIIAQLKSVRGQSIDLSQALKEGLSFFWRYLGLAICMGFVIVIGLLLFIVPGLIMIRRYFLAPYYLIDKDLSIFEAMRMSAADTKPVSAAIWGLIGVIVLFAILTLFLVGIVLIVMYYCAPALRYQQIINLKGGKSKAAAKQAALPA